MGEKKSALLSPEESFGERKEDLVRWVSLKALKEGRADDVEFNPGDVVVDVGASLGPFTYSILNKKPKHVFCFEPCEEEFPTLIKNTLGHPVSHLLKGISSVNGLVDENKLFNSVMGTQNKMETITFKRFLELYDLPKIDFLKTDCEGGEYDIFTDENFNYIKNN